MRSPFLILLLLHCELILNAQKPVIDTSVFEKWPSLINPSTSSLENPSICNNGTYVSYWITNQAAKYPTLILQSTTNNWKKEIISTQEKTYFTADNRKIIVKLPGDSLCIITLGKDAIEFIPFVRSFNVARNGTNEWLAYQVNSPENPLIIRNLQTDKSKRFSGVVDYEFQKTSPVLVIQTESSEGNSLMDSLLYLNLADGNTITVWKGQKCSRFTFNQSGEQMAFYAEEKLKNTSKFNIHIFKATEGKTVQLVTNTSMGIPKDHFISNAILNFSEDGTKLFFSVRKTPQNISVQKATEGVNIWHYKDKYQKSERFYRPNTEECVIDLISNKIVSLNDENENLVFPGLNKGSNNYLLVYKSIYPDSYYNIEDRPSLYLESLRDGKRILIKKHFETFFSPIISPSEKFVIWFNHDSMSYSSYQIATGVERNISSAIPCALYDEDAAKIRTINPFGVAGWLARDQSILIYDRYDIWKVDPVGIDSSVNITHSIGKSQHIAFGIVTPEIAIQNRVISEKQNILLAAYNRDTKENGFWTLNMSTNVGPQKRIMDSYNYRIERVGSDLSTDYRKGMKPIKALEKDVYLVTRTNVRESPNLLVTTNFVTFKQLSNIYPEKQFNWIRNELINWKMTDGNPSQGILYKPDNFDSTKKYPLIFDYYAQRSDELNEYIKPEFSITRINIPYYVSNGYLIFVPDIYYSPGHNGKGVLNSVLSAAKYLCSFPWVDSTKLGLQGHSFGGWETNYLITHSKIFAAACEAAGVSDQVSAYGQLQFGSNRDRQSFYELGSEGSPYGLGVTPWTRPDLYIENSPIFKIGEITTPLLMMHNREDPNVPFVQALELFTGMKRAGKKVWLLDYDKEVHGLVINKNDAIDYTIRMRQFFDHYLKGAAAPVWMTRGIPTDLKGKETGFELDTTEVPK